MKKSILTVGLTALMSGGQFLSAQVGINTDNPTNTLHIVGDTANVKGQAFRLVDGNEQDSAVLVGDENGAGTWMSQHELLANMPYVEIDSLFTICPGWQMIEQAAQRYGKMIQFRIRVRNTLPIIFNSNCRPTNNALIAMPYIGSYRYITYNTVPENQPFRYLYILLTADATNTYGIMNIYSSSSNEELPVGSTFIISGFFMYGANYIERGVYPPMLHPENF